MGRLFWQCLCAYVRILQIPQLHRRFKISLVSCRCVFHFLGSPFTEDVSAADGCKLLQVCLFFSTQLFYLALPKRHFISASRSICQIPEHPCIFKASLSSQRCLCQRLYDRTARCFSPRSVFFSNLNLSEALLRKLSEGPYLSPLGAPRFHLVFNSSRDMLFTKICHVLSLSSIPLRASSFFPFFMLMQVLAL